MGITLRYSEFCIFIHLEKFSGGNRGGNNRRKHWNFSDLTLTGGQVAAGSNPVSPTIKKSLEFQAFRGFFFLTDTMYLLLINIEFGINIMENNI